MQTQSQTEQEQEKINLETIEKNLTRFKNLLIRNKRTYNGTLSCYEKYIGAYVTFRRENIHVKRRENGKRCIENDTIEELEKQLETPEILKFFGEGRTCIFFLQYRFWNRHGTCQSYLHILSVLCAIAEDIETNFRLYILQQFLHAMEDLELNDERLKVVTLENLDTRQMEDLAIYAMGGRNMVSPKEYPECPIAATRQRLYESACAVAEKQIEKYWPGFIVDIDDDPFFDVDWYIYICFLIKRTYDINVFSGDGDEFLFAYLRVVDGLMFVNENLYIFHQSYNSFYSPPKGIKVIYIDSQEESDGSHREIVLFRDVPGEDVSKKDVLVYSNNQTRLQITFPNKDLKFADSPLIKACMAIACPEPLDVCPEDYKGFEQISATLPIVDFVYESTDLKGLVSAPAAHKH